MKKSFLLYLLFSFIAINSVFATSRTWIATSNGIWEQASNWSPSDNFPEAGDDVTINSIYTITVSTNSAAKSVLLTGGAKLVIAANKTLTVSGNNNDGVELIGTGTTLTVNGILNSSNHTNGDGLKTGEGSFVMVASSGSVNINAVDEDGIDLDADLTNEGTISITTPGLLGINTGGDASIDKYLINDGSITVLGGTIGLDGKDSYWFITNNGTLTISGTSLELIDDGSNVSNFGTFKGDGLVENGNNGDVNFQPGSTVAPGTSTGTLTFEESLDISGVTLDIEIEGANDYDKIIVEYDGLVTGGDIDITGTTLSLSGSYVPVGGEEFMILEKTSAGPIAGEFSNLLPGDMIEFNGALFTISYTGGVGGNDVTMTFDSPLPIELLDFSARPMENEVKLAWTTTTETNNDFFSIERSVDGRTFEKIATVAGNGNTTEISKYIHMDTNPANGLNYYRLKQTDFDGQFSYSDIESVEFQKENNINIYPTLVVNTLTIETEGELNAAATVVIRDLTGRTSKSFAISAAERKKEIALFDLIPGHYFITLFNNDTIETLKIIKL